jgi:hypothetical protein
VISGRIALASAVVVTFAVASTTFAQPAGGGKDDGGEIDMGEGSAAATPPAAPPVVQKDPKAAKKTFANAQAIVAKADALAKRGKADDAKAQYAAAEAEYVKAIEQGDDVNVWFYLAGTEAKLGKYVQAVNAYRKVLRAQQGVDPKLQKQVSGKIDEVMNNVGTLALTVTPDGTNITIGSDVVGVSPLPEPLVLMPGQYTIGFTAPGYDPKQQDVKIEAGSESEKKIALDSVKVVIERPRKVGSDEIEKPAEPKKPTPIPAYIAAGVSAGALVATIWSGVLAKHDHKTFVAPGTSPGDRADAHDSGVAYAHLSDACLGGTVVAAGFAAYWYVFQYRKKLHRESAAGGSDSKMSKVDVMPWVEPEANASGLTVFGRF